MKSIRINKDGKPHKSDFKKAKLELKNNFESVELQKINPLLKVYYKRIQAGKKISASRERDEKGRLLGKKLSQKVRENIKDFKLQNKNVEITKELRKIIVDFEKSKPIQYTENLTKLEKKAENASNENMLFVDDGKKVKKVSFEKYALNVSKLKQHLNIYKKSFAMYTRVTVNPNGETVIFLPMAALNLEGEDLSEYLDEFSDMFTAIGS